MNEREVNLDILRLERSKVEVDLDGLTFASANIEGLALRLDRGDPRHFLATYARIGDIKERILARKAGLAALKTVYDQRVYFQEQLEAGRLQTPELIAGADEAIERLGGRIYFSREEKPGAEAPKQEEVKPRLRFLENNQIEIEGKATRLTEPQYSVLKVLSEKINEPIQSSVLSEQALNNPDPVKARLRDTISQLKPKLNQPEAPEFLASQMKGKQSAYVLQGVEVVWPAEKVEEEEVSVPPVPKGPLEPFEVRLADGSVVKTGGTWEIQALERLLEAGGHKLPLYELSDLLFGSKDNEAVGRAIGVVRKLNSAVLPPDKCQIIWDNQNVWLQDKKGPAPTIQEVEVIEGEIPVDPLSQEEAAVIAGYLTRSKSILATHDFEAFPADLADQLGLGISLQSDKDELNKLRIRALEHLRTILGSGQMEQIYDRAGERIRSLFVYFVDREKALDLLDELLSADIGLSWRISKGGEVVDVTPVVTPKLPEELVTPKSPSQGLFAVREIPLAPEVCTPLESRVLKIIVDQLSKNKRLSFLGLQKELYELAVEANLTDRFRDFERKHQFRVFQPEEMRRSFLEAFRKIKLPGGAQIAQDLKLLEDLDSVINEISGGEAQRFQRSVGGLIDNAERGFYNSYSSAGGDRVVWLDIDSLGVQV